MNKLLKNLLKLSLLMTPSFAFAAEGFNWVNELSKAVGLEHFFHEMHIHHYTHVPTFLLIGLALILIGVYYRAKTSNVEAAVIPDKGITMRNMIELYGSFIYGQAKAVLGEKQAPKYYTFLATIFLLILISNMIGLVPGFLPPTESINTTLPFGILTFVYFNYKGCKELGTINYLKHFAGPLWYLAVLIFPIEIISTCIRPISLALRLYGNLFGDHIVLQTFTNLAPLLVPIVFMVLGLLVCFIQAYVFTMLTMVYISLATAHHDHDEHHAHH